MKSKEVLGLLYSDAENYVFFNESEEDLSVIKTEYEIIKKDLDKLEKLEEENEALKMGIESLHTDYKELKQTSEFVIEKFKISNKNLTDENEKLKKVIEILKDKKVNIFHLYVFDTYKQYKEHYSFAGYNKKDILNEKEYDLLKEYL